MANVSANMETFRSNKAANPIHIQISLLIKFTFKPNNFKIFHPPRNKKIIPHNNMVEDKSISFRIQFNSLFLDS